MIIQHRARKRADVGDGDGCARRKVGEGQSRFGSDGAKWSISLGDFEREHTSGRGTSFSYRSCGVRRASSE